MIERLAIRLFWKAEHLDPTEDSGPEDEWFGDNFPSTLSQRRREFWRLMAKEAMLVIGNRE